MIMMMKLMLSDVYRSQGKEKEAEALLKDSIRFGPHFADAYSSLASLYAEQVTQTTCNVSHAVTVPEMLL